MGALNSNELTFSHGRTGGSANSGTDAPGLQHQSPPGQAGTAVMDSFKPDDDESDFSSLSDHNLLTFGDCTEGCSVYYHPWLWFSFTSCVFSFTWSDYGH